MFVERVKHVQIYYNSCRWMASSRMGTRQDYSLRASEALEIEAGQQRGTKISEEESLTRPE